MKKPRIHAFPAVRDGNTVYVNGMDLRDYFAAAALSGLLAAKGVPPSECAKASYLIADDMMHIREQGEW